MSKLALVTGARGGIGTAITLKLVAQNYKVIATYQVGNRESAQEWHREHGFTDNQVQLLELNVNDPRMCSERLVQVMQQEGTIDLLVNNAGITRDKVFAKMTVEQWQEVMDTNLNSLFYVTHPLFAAMCEKGNGRIINISSINGVKGQYGQTNYAAAKAGMIGFTKSLALEAARFGVTVNVVAPGYTGTPMVTALRPDVLDSITAQIPLKRLAKPEEVAACVAFLASDEAGYITGETLSVNGGQYMQ
ncbi:MAG: SDR family oxidoreductase [Shewanella sp.]